MELDWHGPLVFPFCSEALHILLVAALKNIISKLYDLCCCHSDLDAEEGATLPLETTKFIYFHSVPVFKACKVSLSRVICRCCLR